MQIKEYRIPLHIRFNRIFLRPAFRALFHMLGRITIFGGEHVPFGRPYVIAMNHISIFDPPLVISFWPEQPEVIGAADVFEKRGQGPLLSMYGVIPVHRGDYDRALLEKILAILEAGRPLAIAPEGGRSHQPAMRRAKAGIGYIIEHAQVPVLPVGLFGTTDDFWQRAKLHWRGLPGKRGERPQLEMRIGKPIHLPPVTQKGAERREARQRNADLVMRHIAGLLPEEYHGVYAGQAIPPA
ncbi:MAG: lysophospholipid acyltransferase family protein [Anaerolineales bacterium]|nr:MAG: lysophospholipid acyltransferase family protein [Anaerolineales bacterium]